MALYDLMKYKHMIPLLSFFNVDVKREWEGKSQLQKTDFSRFKVTMNEHTCLFETNLKFIRSPKDLLTGFLIKKSAKSAKTYVQDWRFFLLNILLDFHYPERAKEITKEYYRYRKPEAYNNYNQNIGVTDCRFNSFISYASEATKNTKGKNCKKKNNS